MTKNPNQQNLKVIPLGGLGEVGRNMTLFETEKEILICDMGFRMPEETMPGVDYIIPNISYLKESKKKILGVVFTHGHYDHIGAIPYIIDKIWHPGFEFFASPLTKGIIMKRQEDFSNQPPVKITEVKNGSKIKMGDFKIEFFRQNHNIPDNLGIFIETPVGNIVHTSDFKFDSTPIADLPTDFEKIKSFGFFFFFYCFFPTQPERKKKTIPFRKKQSEKTWKKFFKKRRAELLPPLSLL